MSGQERMSIVTGSTNCSMSSKESVLGSLIKQNISDHVVDLFIIILSN